MEIRVDGNRSTYEDWIQAHRVAIEEIPAATEAEVRVAGQLGVSPEDYRRSKYAADLSRVSLAQRADSVGDIVTEWLGSNGVTGKVVAVWLKTLEGKYRVEVESQSGTKVIFIREELVDDLLEGGSQVALDNLNRLLAANFARLTEKRAS